jgi:hypothetical protein
MIVLEDFPPATHISGNVKDESECGDTDLES